MPQYGTFLYGAGFYAPAADDQGVSNAIARVIGGTAIGPKYFYSGAQVGDGTGVAGLKGCWSSRNFVPSELPVGLVATRNFKQELGTNVQVEDEGKGLLILVKKVDSAVEFAILNSFRDTVPAALRAHMQLFGTPDILSCFAESGTMGVAEWAGERYWAWDFTLAVTRIPILSAVVA